MEHEELRAFFESRYGDATGNVVIAIADDDGAPTRQRFFSWKDDFERMCKYVAARSHLDVYYSPTLFATAEARKGTATYSRTVHADSDDFDPADYLLEPSDIVYTSKGHTHCTWFLTDCTDPATIEQLSHGVSNAHPKAETGHDQGWAINKLLRVPTTTNNAYNTKTSHKYKSGAKPFLVTRKVTGKVYTLAEFAAAYPPADTTQVQHRERAGSITYVDALNSVRASTTLMSLLHRDAFAKQSAGSEALYLLYKELFRLGATDEAVFAIAVNCSLNKFARDNKPNSDELLWADILRARAKNDEPHRDFDDFADPKAVVTVAPRLENKAIDFLSEVEQESLPRTFIDDYISWAGSKTDASRSYHEASAFTILSCVFSDLGHTEVSWGPEPLNLWFMSLGRTTLDRKSTARRLMQRVLKSLAVDGVYSYELGSNVTPEGINDALMTRPNRSTMFYRDEIQQFFKDIDTKPYMAGLKGSMTNLYDGTVDGKVRAGGGDKITASTKTSFVFYGMGIKKHVTEHLTIEDFQSGFLARFIYLEGEKNMRSAESDAIRQPSKAERSAGDRVFADMVQNLEAAREHWVSFTPGGATGETIAVPMTDEALARLNKFVTPILDMAEAHERKDAATATATRLTISVMKAAALIAMYDCEEEVQLTHMLSAINHAALWARNMFDIIESVADNAWKRTLDSVTEFVMLKGGFVSWAVCYKHFMGEYDVKQFLRIIDALNESGVINLDAKTKKISLAGATSAK